MPCSISFRGWKTDLGMKSSPSWPGSSTGSQKSISISKTRSCMVTQYLCVYNHFSDMLVSTVCMTDDVQSNHLGFGVWGWWGPSTILGHSGTPKLYGMHHESLSSPDHRWIRSWIGRNSPITSLGRRKQLGTASVQGSGHPGNHKTSVDLVEALVKNLQDISQSPYPLWRSS